MGHLVDLQVENFKSYAGRQYIGTFENFTAIIGPNGSGKSNLIDALGFLFGIKPTQLRSSNLRELIHNFPRINSGGAQNSELKMARVTGSYLKSEPFQKKLIFSRTIDTQGVSNYYINEKRVTFSEYKGVLADENIIIDAKNFMVFQGDIEAVAAKTPKDLSTLIEIISESYQYKTEYEELEKEYNGAVEQATILYGRKRAISGESNMLKQNQSTVEKFEDLKRQHSDTRMFHNLWKLKVLEERSTAANQNMKQIIQDIDNISDRTNELNSTLSTKKMLHSTAVKDLIKLNKTYDQKNDHINASKQKLMSLEGQEKHLDDNMKNASNSLRRAEALHEKQLHIVSGLQSDHDRLNSAISKYKNDIVTLRKTLDLPPNVGIMEVFNSREKEMQLESLSEKSELDLLGAEKKVITDNIQVIESELRNISDEINSRRAIKEKLTWEINNLGSVYEESLLKIKSAEEELSDKTSARRKLAQQEKELIEALAEIRSKIQEHMLRSEEVERIKERALMLESLKRAIPGVQCALSSLYEVKNKKYNLAIATILGSLQHAIITDTQKTAFEAIWYIKEQRLGYSVFIPISGIEVRQQTEHPITIAGARLASDVISFNRSYFKLFKFILKDTVICDDATSAQSCNLKGFKAVTLDGIVFHKNHTVTGGRSKKITQGAHELDINQYTALFGKENEVIEKLQEVAVLKFKMDDNDLSVEIENNKLLASNTSEEIAAIKENVQALDSEILNLTARHDGRNIERENQMRIVEDMEKKIATIKSAIRKNEDTLYRDYDPATLSAIKECKDSESKIRDIEELLKNLHSQLAKTDSQLKFQSGRAVSMKLRDEEIRRIFANDEKKLEIAREEINTINKLIGASSMELNDIKQSLDAAELSVSEYDRACRGIERDMRDLNGRSEHLTRTLFSVEHELERIYMEKSSILLKAQAEQIDIPIVNGLLKDIPRSQIEISYSLGDSSIEYSNTNESVKAPSNKFMAPSLEKIPIDFPKLSEIEILPNEEEQEAIFLNRLNDLSSQIDQLSPSLKSSAKLQECMSQLSAIDKQLSSQQKRANTIKEKFTSVKALRVEKFLKAFKHVSDVIDSIYNELTKTRFTPMGGSACFLLQNPDDPIDGGIKYHVMPPAKRFRDMELLSGGEKTVASLALLFAIHSYRPPPIFLLDEIDAALDKHNIVRVASYISKHASDTLQFIVISLKNSFYETADALIGVYKDNSTNSSMILSLKLKDHYDS